MTDTQINAWYDVISRAYVAGKFSGRGAEEVHTPRALVEEVLDKMLLDGDILVLFNLEFCLSLLYTYNIDASRVTFYSDHPNKTVIAQKLGVRIENDFKKINMRFDSVVTNSPYQDADGNPLYYKFHNFIVKELLKPGAEAAQVTPDAMAVALETGIVKGCHNVEQREIKLINISTDIKKNHFKNVGINNFCYFIVKNTAKTSQPYTIITANGTTQGIVSPLKPLITGPLVDSILAKCFAYDTNFYGGSWNTAGKNATQDPQGKGRVALRIDNNGQLETYPVTWTGSHKMQSRAKVFVSGFGNKAVACYDHDIVCAVEKNLYTVPTANDTESDNLVDLLDCDLREFFKRVIKARGDRVDFLRHFKGLPLTAKWTAPAIYKHFNLTQAEIDYINTVIA
jgi:hypothetical protein